MPDKPPVQKLLSGKPICSKCMHGHQVEIITGRENSPVEYHCGCGNYAVVGMPARWPFMVPKKEKEREAGKVFVAAFTPLRRGVTNLIDKGVRGS